VKINWKRVALILALIILPVAYQVMSLLAPELSQINFKRNLKKRVTEQQLHAWAAQILAPYQTNYDPELQIEITNLPSAFQGLYKWKPHAYIYGDNQVCFNCAQPIAYIKINYGSAASHFGVIFGPTNLPTPPDIEHDIHYTPWVPGAWFFDSQ
jgi:hypothetical protein